MNPQMIEMLMHQYDLDPRQFTDRQAEQIAMLARQYGFKFSRESKPLRKFAFDLADTALLGMLPNTLRPVSRGQSVFGETQADRIAGGLGTGVPLAAGGLLALANAGAVGSVVGKGLGYAGIGARGAKRGLQKAVRPGGIFERGAEGAGRVYKTAKDTYETGLQGSGQFGPGFLDMMSAAWNRGAGNPLRQTMAGRPWGYVGV
jgi:hypothetical protein